MGRLAPLSEEPINGEEDSTNSSKKGRGLAWRNWIKTHLSLVFNKKSDLRILLSVLGCPLFPIPLHPKQSIINEVSSSAQYIIQHFTAATGCRKLEGMVKSIFATGKVTMAMLDELGSGGSAAGANRVSQKGCFVMWQMVPNKWLIELVVGGHKVVAGSDGSVAWRHTPWLGAHTARGGVRPLRRALQVFYNVERRSNWSDYDNYCRTHGLKYPLLVKRLACMVISGVAAADSFDILQPASLSPVMVSEMEEGFSLLRSAFTKANICDEQVAFLTNTWYTSVLARIRINAFRVELVGGLYEDLLSSAAASVEAEAAVGNAVYMLPSFYNHDCDPNAHILWIENAGARLKVLRDVEAGEELRICYIDASMDRDARQTLLSQGFGFQCNCFRCSSGD